MRRVPRRTAVETSKSMEQLLVDAAEAEDEATRDITNSYNPKPRRRELATAAA